MSTASFVSVRGQPVLSRTTAEKVGNVDRLIVDIKTGRVTGVVIGQGRHAQVADWGAITGVGPDAVVIDSEAHLADEQQPSLPDLWGRRLLTDLGTAAGMVTDVIFDAETGALQEVVGDNEVFGPTRLLGLGSYALVVRDAASGG